MSLKRLLGLEETGISDAEIAAKLIDAQKKNLDEVDFIKADGSTIQVKLPKNALISDFLTEQFINA